jgi:RNA 3'-terminal phosphate cyclase
VIVSGAEVIAGRASDEALRYLQTDAPVDEHLADQLLIPLTLGKRGSF